MGFRPDYHCCGVTVHLRPPENIYINLYILIRYQLLAQDNVNLGLIRPKHRPDIVIGSSEPRESWTKTSDDPPNASKGCAAWLRRQNDGSTSWDAQSLKPLSLCANTSGHLRCKEPSKELIPKRTSKRVGTGHNTPLRAPGRTSRNKKLRSGLLALLLGTRTPLRA